MNHNYRWMFAYNYIVCCISKLADWGDQVNVRIIWNEEITAHVVLHGHLHMDCTESGDPEAVQGIL